MKKIKRPKTLDFWSAPKPRKIPQWKLDLSKARWEEFEKNFKEVLREIPEIKK